MGFALLSLVFLLVFQALMGFAFIDAAVMEIRLDKKNAHAEPVDRLQFYVRPPLSDTLPSASDAPRYVQDNDGLVTDNAGQTTTPMNCAASILAIILLCTGPLNIDDQQTLHCLQPLNHLLFAPWWKAAPFLVLWRVLVTPLLHLLWVTRVFFLPAVAGMGTALAMSHASSAIDIVLCVLEDARTHQRVRRLPLPTAACRRLPQGCDAALIPARLRSSLFRTVTQSPSRSSSRWTTCSSQRQPQLRRAQALP
jgi:hypothetical protein